MWAAGGLTDQAIPQPLCESGFGGAKGASIFLQLCHALGPNMQSQIFPCKLTPNLEWIMIPEQVLAAHRHGGPVEVCIQWKGHAPEEALWEPLNTIWQQFLGVHLGDKVMVDEGALLHYQSAHISTAADMVTRHFWRIKQHQRLQLWLRWMHRSEELVTTYRGGWGAGEGGRWNDGEKYPRDGTCVLLGRPEGEGWVFQRWEETEVYAFAWLISWTSLSSLFGLYQCHTRTRPFLNYLISLEEEGELGKKTWASTFLLKGKHTSLIERLLIIDEHLAHSANS